jgi:dTDP-4-dehydrorhamnose 3,5-epimerase
METYNEAALNLPTKFVQDNQSFNGDRVIRGLHYQSQHPQAKLVRVVKGTVTDSMVDLRRDSPTFGKAQSVVLDNRLNYMLYIPEGFAHGFQALEPNTIFAYKVSDYQYPEFERSLHFYSPLFHLYVHRGAEFSKKDLEAPLVKTISELEALLR